MTPSDQNNAPSLFGHPTGLFTLFFAEMWERFSYYGMRALLVFYMIKGFLGYGDREAYAVYGAYTALVYMTPFFGGMLADRLLGARRAVIFGALLMAAGQALLMVQIDLAFFTGLGLLVAGNGFFKPNISTIVGSLYPPGSPRRDGGFTIFYMGINLGAAMSPLLCGYIGESYGWHWGFGLATVGMLTGLAVFVGAIRVTQVVILVGALAAAGALVYYHPQNPFSTGVNVFVALALLTAAGVAMLALERGGIPAGAGAPPDPARLRRRVGGVLPAEWLVYLLTALTIPLFMLLVSGLAPLTTDHSAVALLPESLLKQLQANPNPLVRALSVVLHEASRPAGLVLVLAGLVAFGYLGFEAVRLPTIARQRMYVVLILTFFSMLFWSFFEQAGSSVNNFTDRNVDRVLEARRVGPGEVGTTITMRIPPDTDDKELGALPLLSQEQLGHRNADPAMKTRIVAAARSEEQQKRKMSPEEIEKLVRSLEQSQVLTLTGMTYLRNAAAAERAAPADRTLQWTFVDENIGMGLGGSEIPASTFQAANPVFILLFGLVLSALWTYLGTRGLEPSTTVKFALGLLQLGLGFAAFWYGARSADPRGMVVAGWLLLGYLLHTTGELCLSPVGLSMVTRLSPARLVSTVMGAWFLATAFSQFLAAIIAQFTGVAHGEGGGQIPAPLETVAVYGGVFGKIAVSALVSAAVCFALSPLLNRWMHPHAPPDQG